MGNHGGKKGKNQAKDHRKSAFTHVEPPCSKDYPVILPLRMPYFTNFRDDINLLFVPKYVQLVWGKTPDNPQKCDNKDQSPPITRLTLHFLFVFISNEYAINTMWDNIFISHCFFGHQTSLFRQITPRMDTKYAPATGRMDIKYPERCRWRRRQIIGQVFDKEGFF